MFSLLSVFLAYWGTNRIAASRGRLSPVWGLAAAGLSIALQLLFELTGPPIGYDQLGRILAELTLAPLAIGSAVVVGLVLFLPRIDQRQAEKTSRIPYRNLGWSLLLLAVAYPVVIFARQFSIAPTQTIGPQISPWLGLIVFGLLSVGIVCLQLGRRARLARDALDSDETDVAVLILRGFSVDLATAPRRKLFGRIPWRWSEPDQAIDGHLTPDLEARIGPVVTLGSPEDYLPPIGARRIYAHDAHWRRRVSDLARAADWVLMIEGVGDGLAWEMAWLRKHKNPGRVLLLTLPRRFRVGGVDQWPALRRVAVDLGYDLPEHSPEPGSLLRFDAHWTGHVALEAAETGEAVATAIRSLGEATSETASAPPPPPKVEEVLNQRDETVRKPPQAASITDRFVGAGLIAGAMIGAVFTLTWREPIPVSFSEAAVRFEFPRHFSPPEMAEDAAYGSAAEIPVYTATALGRRAEAIISVRLLPLGAHASLPERARRARQDMQNLCTEAWAPSEETAPPVNAIDLFFRCYETSGVYDLRMRVIEAGARTVRLAMITHRDDAHPALWADLTGALEIGAEPPPSSQALTPAKGPAFYYFPFGQLARYDLAADRSEVMIDHIASPLAIDTQSGAQVALVGEDQILWLFRPRDGGLSRGPRLAVADTLEPPARGAWSPGDERLALFHPHWWGEEEIVALNRHRGLRIVAPKTGAVRHFPDIKWFLSWRGPTEVLHQRAREDGRIGLYLLNIDTEEEREVDVSDAPDGFVGFHRIGDKAVYLELTPRIGAAGIFDHRLMLMDLDMLRAEPVPGVAPGPLSTPRLSPDGGRILFKTCPDTQDLAPPASSLLSPPSESCLLRVIDLEGRPQISWPVGAIDAPRWVGAEQVVVSGGRRVTVLGPNGAKRELPLDGFVIGTL